MSPRPRGVITAPSTEGLLRELAPRVLGAVVRRYDDFADAEDAVQEALLAAATTWTTGGEPDNPLAWLIRMACHRMVDQYRRADARRRREDLAASWSPACPDPASGRDDKRLRLVLHVLYLLFKEDYASSSGPDPARTDLSGEAIRLARDVRAAVPEDPEVAGLLALMLLTDARRRARTRADGELVPLAEQDRTLWDRVSSPRGWPSSPRPCSGGRWASTRCRPPSRPSTTRLPATPTPTGPTNTAIVEFRAAAARTANLRERHYLTTKAARLATEVADD